jgi:hypothetical protein
VQDLENCCTKTGPDVAIFNNNERKTLTRLATLGEEASKGDNGDAGETGYVEEQQVTQHHAVTTTYQSTPITHLHLGRGGGQDKTLAWGSGKDKLPCLKCTVHVHLVS